MKPDRQDQTGLEHQAGAESAYQGLSPQGMEAILTVISRLAAPFDLNTMLAQVVDAARSVLQAEEGLVWLYDAGTDQLALEMCTLADPVRSSVDTGIIGACARSRQLINVPDCGADPRFTPELYKPLRLRPRSMLAIPLIDHQDELVGVLQVLNKRNDAFGPDDEVLAKALAAQCVVALQRVRMTGAMIDGERMRQELEMAREVQMSTLPVVMPELSGYDLYGVFRPAGLTGGDTFDLIRIEQGLFILMGDATGHGIAPALSATQMQAMLRVAFRLDADLESAIMHVNNQLLEDLPEDRFVTAFVGLLDPETHAVRFHSGGQGPILHYQAARGRCACHKPNSFPFAAAPMPQPVPAVTLEMAPGDILALISDGIYEYNNMDEEEFGEERVSELIQSRHELAASELAAEIFAAVEAFAGDVLQKDDMTVVLVKRRSDQK